MEEETVQVLEESGEPESVQETAEQQIDSSESESSESESSDTELEGEDSSTTSSPEPSQTNPVTLAGSEGKKVTDTTENNADTLVELMMQIPEMRNFSSLIFFLFVSIFVAFLLKKFLE